MAEENQPSDKRKPNKKEKNNQGDLISKFRGEGLSFKAKLYGSVDVETARGDEMCQKALLLLKSVFKNSNQHKQRILIKINIEGVVLVDITTNKCLVEHQVNKISFISKDCTDSRSFSYVVGNTGGKHVLYGIKTEKPAEPVLLAFRDLFHAVYQLKEQASKRSSQSSGQSAESVPKAVSSSELQGSSPTGSKKSTHTSDIVPPLTSVPVEATADTSSESPSTGAAAAATPVVSESNSQKSSLVESETNSSDNLNTTQVAALVTTQSDSNQEGSVTNSGDVTRSGDVTNSGDVTRSGDVTTCTNELGRDGANSHTDCVIGSFDSFGIAENKKDGNIEPGGQQTESTMTSKTQQEEQHDQESSMSVEQRNLSELEHVTGSTPELESRPEETTTQTLAEEKPLFDSLSFPGGDKTDVSLWKETDNSDDFFSADFIPSENKIVKENDNPWGEVVAASSADPWAAFETSDNVTESTEEKCPWGTDDNWVTRAADSTQDSLVMAAPDSSETHQDFISTEKVDCKVSEQNSIDNSTSSSINNIEGNIHQPSAQLTESDSNTKEEVANFFRSNKFVSFEEDPFANHQPFLHENPFADQSNEQSDPFSSDPFGDIDPFASAVPAVKSSQVDVEPFASSDDFFTNISTTSVDLSHSGGDNQSENKLEPRVAGENTTSDLLQEQFFLPNLSAEEVDGEVADKKLQILACDLNFESQPSFGPPSLPPPALPPEVLNGLNVSSNTLPERPVPPVPARKSLASPPPSNDDVPCKSSAPPAVPARKLIRKSSGSSNKLEDIESRPPSSPAPSLPPSFTPPAIPHRSEPPKLPARNLPTKPNIK